MLEAVKVGKYFGGLRALDDVSFKVRQGQIKGLIGPNGAGKSTMLGVISGFLTADAGSVSFKGESLASLPPYRIARKGIGRTFQIPQPLRLLNAIENVMIGRERFLTTNLLDNVLLTPKARREESVSHQKALDCLNLVGLGDKATEAVGVLTAGQLKLMELARALALDPELMLLDEPAASLNDTERMDLRVVLRKINQRGITIFLIEHDMDLVMDVCDDMVVLNFGRCLADGTPKEIQGNPVVREAYLGGKS